MSTAMNPSRKHAYTDAGATRLPEPTYAERVRTIQIQRSSDWNALSRADSRRELITT
jgi:hypothetical protein